VLLHSWPATCAWVHVVGPQGVPYLAGPQVPSNPVAFRAALHAWHTPVQGLSQQTPSTQKPLVQSLGSVQGVPLPPGATQAD
jgi:hypothetical protein